jgi:hypothetical protein
VEAVAAILTFKASLTALPDLKTDVLACDPGTDRAA